MTTYNYEIREISHISNRLMDSGKRIIIYMDDYTTSKMKIELSKIVKNEHVDFSSIFKMSKLGLIKKITYTQYVLTKKGMLLLNTK